MKFHCHRPIIKEFPHISQIAYLTTCYLKKCFSFRGQAPYLPLTKVFRVVHMIIIRYKIG